MEKEARTVARASPTAMDGLLSKREPVSAHLRAASRTTHQPSRSGFGRPTGRPLLKLLGQLPRQGSEVRWQTSEKVHGARQIKTRG